MGKRTVRQTDITPPTTTAAGTRASRWMLPALALLLFLLRWAVLSRSLWYDEIYTVSNFAGQSWQAIVSGDYSPNNHILSSLLIKATDQTGEGLGLWPPLLRVPGLVGTLPVVPDDGTLRFRLPAMIAGVLASLALAWPLRPKAANPGPTAKPGPFVALVLLGGAQPWLLAFSIEARGYALALALGLLSTNILRHLDRGRWIWYALAMTGAIYTIPIAGLLLAGHALTVIVLQRKSLGRWLMGAGLALALSALLYAPFYAGMRHQAAAMGSPIGFLAFLGQTLRCGATGWNSLGVWAVIVALLLLAGIPWAWKEERLRAAILSFGATGLLALALPLAWPPLAQSRFAFWLIPLWVMGAYGWIMRWHHVAARAVVAAILSAWMAGQIIMLAHVPASPALDAIESIAEQSPPDARIVCVYLGSLDACSIYEAFLEDRSVFPIVSTAYFDAAVDPRPGHTWYLVVFPEALHRQAPDLESRLHADADCVADLPGRIERVQVFRRRDPAH